MTRGFDRPPWWAWVAVGATVIFVGVSALIAHNRPAAAAAFTPLTSAPSSAAPKVPVIAVFGDSYTGGTALGGQGTKNWAQIVGRQVHATMRVAAAGGGGYVQVSPFTHGTFTDLIAAHPPTGADLVIVFGSRNDSGQDPAEVQSAAAADFAAITHADPAAKLLVVGPCWSAGTPPAGALAARDAVQKAAVAAGATFVDPLSGGWFSGRTDLIGSDGVHPTDAGHAYLADKIEPAVRSAIG